ncbi:4Fe-4S dicluster domain-containing protein [Heliorestis acidaminivorans]|uniref:4Fe-4S dicluster domain-containing protein n=1 Tax=Heliorestis acidaminivorans TaxID=553427 RepID=A0A6I0F299_9FIRM|nr:4Fe-4S binding protein [Heliorestis acidaminivorans]KAB2952376.1 4Fe-4S dicluster domain-containing protein [Heliorestis acidaminivorans]
MLYIDSNKCDKFKGCPPAKICPTKAIIPVGSVRFFWVKDWVIDEEKCINCKKCIEKCPHQAILEK